jgi:hypothetical protein
VTFFAPSDQDLNGNILDAIGNTEWNLLNPIQFVYDPVADQILRVEGGVQRILAVDATAVTFEDQTHDATLNPDEMRMSVTLQRRAPNQRFLSATVVETVKLRN